MFTGIVESIGTISAARETPTGRRLAIVAETVWNDIPAGASVAVNGVCLTVAQAGGKECEFDVIAETLACSTLRTMGVGNRVNLERSLRVGDRLDGHFVQGHVDGTAQVAQVQSSAREWVIWCRAEESLRRFIIPKGSIALDGVSLTIAAVREDQFSVALIPTTLQRTTLGALRTGDRVNLETDIIVRTVVHHLDDSPRSSGLTWDRLREVGFA